MKIRGRSKSGLALRWASDFKRIHGCAWEGVSQERLAARLRECAREEDERAEAYGILREIIRRKTGLALFDAQLMAAHSMTEGRIAELATGEGKTLAAVVAAALFALRGRTVHVLVFNDYLAERDSRANRPIYEVCGLTCGCVVEASGFAQRQAAYACDVVYVAAKEAGFDCLRDFLCTDKERLLLPRFDVALVDEADSILIDEARVPLVLAGGAQTGPAASVRISRAVAALSRSVVGVDERGKRAWLTDRGVRAMEAALDIDNLFLPRHADTLALVYAAVEARFLLRRDRDYIIKDGAVRIVDEATGRVSENRRFPELLQQAVEMQTLGVRAESSAVYHTMTIQAFLRQYEMLCGMTGTAASSAYEFRQMYDLTVDVIPPHVPCIRLDHPDAVFDKREAHEAAILSCIRAAHEKMQPVLVGTRSVNESERFSALLRRAGIAHAILNARNDAEEADIIAQAGRPGQVTISTNMAGRGVDIRLGGLEGREADRAREAGGLLIVSTGINRSLRVDNQLRGRAGRQGDPGESRFFVCLMDVEQDIPFEMAAADFARNPRLLRRAQRAREREDIEARYMLEQYSNIMEMQAGRITEYRTRLLRQEAAPDMLRNEDEAFFRQLESRVGARGVALAETQLTLYFINMNWALYLEAMEEKRGGIHLMVIGGKSPLDEYTLFAASAFEEMLGDVRRDVVSHMHTCDITENGIDMEKAGLLGATTTWTYMINDNPTQFSRLPRMIKAASNTVRGKVYSLRGLFEKIKRKLRRAK